MCVQKDGLERTAVHQVGPWHTEQSLCIMFCDTCAEGLFLWRPFAPLKSHPLEKHIMDELNVTIFHSYYGCLLPPVFASLHTVCDPPCKNGACSEDMRCVCSEGWTGEDCSTLGGSFLQTHHCL